MRIGLRQDNVKVVPYDPSWKESFIDLKKELMKMLSIEEERIEHIGNTAIVGIPAKPIIDILLGVNNLKEVNPKFEKKLQKLGFFKLLLERQNEVVFAKFKDSSMDLKTHYLHVFQYESPSWEQLIVFRDSLNKDHALRDEFVELKSKIPPIKEEQEEERFDFVQNILKINLPPDE